MEPQPECAAGGAPAVAGTGVQFVSALQRLQAQALQHADPLQQRAFELKLAAHGPLGDLGDLGLLAGKVGQLVQAFAADDGRIHVGDQQALAPVRCGHEGDIDGQILHQP